MIAAPLSPDFPVKPVRSRQDGIAGFGTRMLVLPWFGVLASRGNRLRATLRDRFVTAFSVVDTVTNDARNGLVGVNLVH